MKNGAGSATDKLKAPRAEPPKKVNLALQGGGSHGALTWGVLDRLLEDERIDFDGISGASAGAINGALMGYGLIVGGRPKAREVLADFWNRVGNSSIFGQVPTNWLQAFMPGIDSGLNLGLDFLSRAFSPYQLNPLNYNPLRNMLEDAIDYEILRESKKYRLFVGATNVLRGSMRIFESHEITVDALLASACVPLIFQAVSIGGEQYWDGGYLGNPTLYPLIKHCGSQDIMIVQINPTHRKELPTDPIGIADRINEISFNASLQSEIEAIELINHLLRAGKLAGNADGLKEMFLHQLGDETHMANYGAISKLSTDRALIDELHDFGYEAAGKWLAKNFGAIGRESTYRPGPQQGHPRRAAKAYTESV